MTTEPPDEARGPEREAYTVEERVAAGLASQARREARGPDLTPIARLRPDNNYSGDALPATVAGADEAWDGLTNTLNTWNTKSSRDYIRGVIDRHRPLIEAAILHDARARDDMMQKHPDEPRSLLQSEGAATTPGASAPLHDARERGLDVERLAEAIDAWWNVDAETRERHNHPYPTLAIIPRMVAQAIAREYAALSDRVPGETP